MRRLLSVLLCVALLALALAGAAAAGNGGLAPPAPASPNASGIRDVYWLILGITGGILLLVEGTLILFVVRYRSRGRPRELEGPQVIGHANLELAWTVAPVLLLAAIAAFVFYKVSDIQGAPSAAGIETIRIEAHQYYWDFVYPDGTMSVDTLHLPFRRAVRLELTSADVAHSWWVPALGGKLDAIPGRTNRLKYFPSKLGVFRGQCAEFCGLIHAAMLARVEVMPVRQYEAWRAQRRGATAELGRETFVGACAKCHGLAAQGGIGPPIAQSPVLADRKALTMLIREGRGLMPAVGQDWNDEQLNATLAYLRKRFVKGGGGGG